jgi:hypothetical protein
MKAAVGDRLVVNSRHVDQPGRIGEIVEVHGPDGTAPYVVRWVGTAETAVVVPGPDAHIEPADTDLANRG